MGDAGWNEAQVGVLDEIPVLLITGSFLTAVDGDPEFWPHDGLVSEHSALARGVNNQVLPHRFEATYPLLHSIYIAAQLGEDWQSSVTWNSAVLERIREFLENVRYN